MRKLFTILGLIASALAVILAVLPLYNFAFFVAIVAFIFGLFAFLDAKKENKPKHTIQLIFLLTIIALALATYKTITNKAEVGNTEQLELREEESLENSIEELDEELEDIEIDDLDDIDEDLSIDEDLDIDDIEFSEE